MTRGDWSTRFRERFADWYDFCVSHAVLMRLPDAEDAAQSAMCNLYERGLRMCEARPGILEAEVCVRQNLLWSLRTTVRKHNRRWHLHQMDSIDAMEAAGGGTADSILASAGAPKPLECKCPSVAMVQRETLALVWRSLNGERRIFQAMAECPNSWDMVYAARRLRMKPNTVRHYIQAARALLSEVVKAGKRNPDVEGIRRRQRKQHDAALNGGRGPAVSDVARERKRLQRRSLVGEVMAT